MLNVLTTYIIIILFILGKTQQCQNCLNCVDRRCQICNKGYSLTQQNFCVKSNQENCKLINSAGQCLSCNSMYNLILQKCQQPSSQFCIKDSQNTCQKCLYGTKLQNGKCTGILNCKEYHQNGYDCKICHNNHILRYGKCHATLGCILNQHNGMCQQCQEQYLMKNSICIRKSKLILHCQTYSYESICLKCQKGYIYNSQENVCQLKQKCLIPHPFKDMKCLVCIYQYYGEDCKKVSKLCKQGKYNLLSGHCTQCTLGYQLNEKQGKCYDPNCQQIFEDRCLKCKQPFIQQKNSLCMYDDKNCLLSGFDQCFQCKQEYFYDGTHKICRKHIQNCKIQNFQVCQECEQDYYLINNQCIKIVDKNCKIFDENSQCVQCSFRYYKNQNNKCTLVNPLCQTYNSVGDCITCYRSFQIKNNRCVLQQIKDKNCKISSNDGCLQCYNRYYVGQDGRCKQVNVLCNKYDSQNGNCLSCFPGYSLRNHKCIIEIVDPFCKILTNNQNCEQCLFTFYYSLSTKRCQRVNPLCRTYDKQDGNCTSCYQGYALIQGNCELSRILQNCKYIQNNECIECFQKYYLNEGKCVKVNPLCKQHRNNECLSCYPGYELLNDSCILQKDKQDRNCKIKQNDKCLECFQGFSVQENGRCQKRNDQCSNFSQQLSKCFQCFPGYELLNDSCILQKDKQDRNCKIKQNDKCLECFQGFSVLENGRCQKRNDQCSNFSQQLSKCFQCFPGYTLNQKFQCIDLRFIRTDVNCISYNQNQCQKCSNGYFLNKNQKCQIINQLCKTHINQLCLSCYQGYVLQDGLCINPVQQIFQIPNCQTYHPNATCSSCLTRFYLKNNQCFFVSPLCLTYNQTNGQCLSCRSQLFNLQNGNCIQLNQIVQGCIRYQGPFCGQCQSSQGYYLTHQRKCYKLDPNCQVHNFALSICQKCDKNFNLLLNKCQ